MAPATYARPTSFFEIDRNPLILAPRPFRLPPKYSATTAVITVSGAATRTPVKRNDIAFGKRTFTNCCRDVAANERISSNWVGELWRRPRDTLTNTTKNAAIVVMIRRGVSLSAS